MASLTGETANLGEGRAAFGPRGRIAARFLLYSLVSIQFVVILSIMRQMCQAHPLSLGILALPILYLSPLVMGAVFRHQINTLLRSNMVSVKVADICNDWITIILLVVYTVILDFRLLHP